MSILRPFRALRPTPEHVARVAAVPYDVVDRSEAAALAEGQPMSFLHVSRAEIDLPESVDPYDPAVYRKAAENLARLRDEGILLLDEQPALYIYRLQMGDHVQTGVAGTFSVDEYDQDRIKKHEKTRKAKEDDRTRHILATRAQTGPVFLTYRGTPKLEALVETACQGDPLYDFTSPDGIRHTTWRVTTTGPRWCRPSPKSPGCTSPTATTGPPVPAGPGRSCARRPPSGAARSRQTSSWPWPSPRTS